MQMAQHQAKGVDRSSLFSRRQRRRFRISLRGILLLICAVATVIAVAMRWQERVSAESAFVEFQNLGFEALPGDNGRITLFYPGEQSQLIDLTLVPHVRSLENVDSIMTGKTSVSLEVLHILQMMNIQVDRGREREKVPGLNNPDMHLRGGGSGAES